MLDKLLAHCIQKCKNPTPSWCFLVCNRFNFIDLKEYFQYFNIKLLNTHQCGAVFECKAIHIVTFTYMDQTWDVLRSTLLSISCWTQHLLGLSSSKTWEDLHLRHATLQMIVKWNKCITLLLIQPQKHRWEVASNCYSSDKHSYIP